ncbi:MAG: sigma-70 family RNA polymerase sigma factor [Planctomycetes bacterium]|nr:sigma-70 family RNA polymerase sigma factor [Planctomycetota bacterium]
MPDYTEDPDVRLMLAFQRGDEEAFAALVTKYQRSVLGTIYRYTGDRDACDDLAQDIFVRVWNARASYAPSAKFGTWLFRIVTNMCLNEIRDRRLRRTLPLVEDDLLGAGAERAHERPTQVVRREELREQVREALSRLPPNQRLALILDKFEDLSYEEIAARMSLTTMAVKSLLFRARASLKVELAAYLDVKPD